MVLGPGWLARGKAERIRKLDGYWRTVLASLFIKIQSLYYIKNQFVYHVYCVTHLDAEYLTPFKLLFTLFHILLHLRLLFSYSDYVHHAVTSITERNHTDMSPFSFTHNQQY